MEDSLKSPFMGQCYVVEQFSAVSSGAKVVHEHYSLTMLEESFEGPQSVRMFCGFKFGCQPNTLGFAMGRRPCNPVQSSRVRQTKLYKFSYTSTVSLGLLSSLISMDTLLDKERMLLMSRVNAEKPAC